MSDFQIIGLDKLVLDLSKFGMEALKEIKPDVDKGGDILLNKAKEKAPVRLETLRNSLRLKRSTSAKKFTYTNTLTWGDDVRAYAAPVELGHGLVMFGKRTNKFVAARPFLRPAADESREQILTTVIAGMDRALKKKLGDRA